MGRRARHLRRGRSRILIVVLAVALLGTASSAALLKISRGRARISVTVLIGGIPRPVRVLKPATVAAALREARVVPRPGQLVSLVSHKVLDPAFRPTALLVDGQPATAATVVVAGGTIGVIEPPDVTEDAIDGGDVIPAPPEPDVIKGLWHPGQPGKAISHKGAVSGEIVSQQQVQAPVPPAPVTEKLVALTFDDGPWPTTPEILRILREKNVKALFCVVSRQVKGDRLAMVKTALDEGHHICNHTVDHDQQLPKKAQNVIDDEIIGANQQLSERLGIKPTYYRPPGGALGPNVVATAKAQGQQVLVWTVDPKDYTRPPPAAIVGTVMAQVQPGGVVLMHDGGGDRANTIAALPVIIDQLRAAGYELVLPDAVAPVPAAPVTAVPPPA
ncbi:MAG: polysaccharide deacetylase family protein [Acidimicrobiales bacterium]